MQKVYNVTIMSFNAHTSGRAYIKKKYIKKKGCQSDFTVTFVSVGVAPVHEINVQKNTFVFVIYI